MRKLLITALLPVALFVTCKKSETELPPPPMPGDDSPSFSWDHTPGSYYVYQWYTIDSLGNETPYSAPDTNTVVGDTVINGNTYTTFYNDHIFLQSQEVHWRDSSGYIVDQNGNIHFSYTAFNDTVQDTDISGWFTIHHILGASVSQISVPAGEFDVYQKRQALELGEGTPPVTCTESLGFDNYFDATTGIPVIQQTSFSGEYMVTCRYYERRLVEYYIAE